MSPLPLLFMLWAQAATTTGFRGEGGGRFETPTAPALRRDVAPSRCWTRPLETWSNASPVLLGDLVCVTLEPTTIACHDVHTGEERWRATSDVADTLDPAGRAALQTQLAASAEAAEALRETQRRYSALRRDVRADPSLAGALEALTAELSRLKALVAAAEPFLTPPVREVIGYAGATPVTDGQTIYAVFGNGVVSAFSQDGERRWSVWLGPPPVEMNGYHMGTATSPVLVDGVLVVGHRHLLALDPSTGRERWRAGPWVDYGTPSVVRLGTTAWLATPAGELVRARDGRVAVTGLGTLWFVGPVVSGDRVFYVGGKGVAQLQAEGALPVRGWRLRPEGDTVRADPLWQVDLLEDRAIYSAPVFHEERLYFASSDGRLWVLDAATGAPLSKRGTQGVGEVEQIYAPLALAGGRLFLASEGGSLLEIQPGAPPELLGHAPVGGTRAGPTFDAAGRLYLRTLDALICLEPTP